MNYLYNFTYLLIDYLVLYMKYEKKLFEPILWTVALIYVWAEFVDLRLILINNIMYAYRARC